MATKPKAKGATVLRLIDCKRERDDAKASEVQGLNRSILLCLLEDNSLGKLGAMVVTADYVHGEPGFFHTGSDLDRALALTARTMYLINSKLDDVDV